MTKMMSLSLILLFLNSSHVICSEKMTLEQKLALQERRLKLCYQMGSFYEQQEPKKQKSKKYDEPLNHDIEQKEYVYDFIGNHEYKSFTIAEDSLIRFSSNSKDNQAIVKVLSSVQNIAIQFQDGAHHNNVILDMQFSGNQGISYIFEKNSHDNDLVVHTYNNFEVSAADYPGYNSVRFYSPLRKLIMPTLLVVMLCGCYKILFSK